jgi:hypothetical protein
MTDFVNQTLFQALISQVNACPATTCELYFVPDENCECKCGLTEDGCADYQTLNTKLCRCDMKCDIIKACPLGQRFDMYTCECVVNVCPGVEQCPSNRALNSNCECQCIDNGENCDGFFDHEFCTCNPIVCDHTDECPPGMKWDLDVCNCVKIECPDVQCGENFVFDENCNCQCPLTQDSCQPWEKVNPDNCTCYPHFECDITMDCPPGEKWDGSSDVCSCVPYECETFAACEDNFAFDENCECQCYLTQETCDRDYPGTQLMGCGCVFIDPCPEEECPAGEEWSFEECKCVNILKIYVY